MLIDQLFGVLFFFSIYFPFLPLLMAFLGVLSSILDESATSPALYITAPFMFLPESLLVLNFYNSFRAFFRAFILFWLSSADLLSPQLLSRPSPFTQSTSFR